jgi:2-polyprenyl-3-methyl-5-hydroxy-6-metoxy-1,4-benzoquinol methylase
MTLNYFLSQLYHEYTDPDLLKYYLTLIHEFGPKKSVLELGGGEGLICDRLDQAQCVVSDINQDALKIAEEKGYKVMIQDVLTPLPKDFGVYTMMSDVINYINHEDLELVFKNISSALEYDDIFIFDSLNSSYLKNLCPYEEEITVGHLLYKWSLEIEKEALNHQFIAYNQTFQMTQYLHEMKDIKILLDKYHLEIKKQINLEDRDIVLLMLRK